MARIDPKFMLRIPEELRDRIRQQAEANNRSMNAEILARLERTFEFKGYVENMDKDWVKDFLKHAIDKATEELMAEMKESGQPIEVTLKKG